MALPKFHGGTHHRQGTLNRGITRPEATSSPGYHAGSGRAKGTLHAPPSQGAAVNDQNYGGHKVKRK